MSAEITYAPGDVTVGGGATEGTLQQIRDGKPNKDFRFDYVDRTDGSPVYIGIAVEETPETDATWSIFRFTWDVGGNVTEILTRTGRWDQRTTLF